MTRARRWVVAAATVVAMAAMASWSAVAWACPFCSTAKTGSGYLIATLVLLAIPFTALAMLVLWLRRNAKASVDPDPQEDHGSPTL